MVFSMVSADAGETMTPLPLGLLQEFRTAEGLP